MASEQEKLLFVKELLGLEMLRFHHYKIKIDPKRINDLLIYYMTKDMDTLRDQYDFLIDWVDNHFNYESGTDEEDE